MEQYEIELVADEVEPIVSAVGTNTVPISSPVPFVVTLPDGERSGVFPIDWNRLTSDQKTGLAGFVSETQGISVAEAMERIPSEPVYVDARYCIMRRVSQSQIDLIRRGFAENYKTQHPEADHLTEVVMTAREVVCLMLGHDWWVRNVWQELGGDARRMQHLRLDMATETAPTESADRVVDLADSLFSVQYSEGFDLKLDELRALSPNRPDVPLEDIAMELQIAKMLVRSGHRIEFVRPTGERGQDFDLRLILETGETANVEIKCKREETSANPNSLRNSLNDLRRQLPKGTAGIGFVRLPYEWVSADGFTDDLGSVLDEFFRNTSRVNVIVLVWEEWVDLADGKRARLLKFRPELNPSPACPAGGLSTILPALDEVRVDDAAHFRLSFGDFGPSA